MDRVWESLLMMSTVPFVLMVICLGAAGLAFLREAQLGAAAVVAGCGFGALAVVSALKIFMYYVQLSRTVNHTPMSEILPLLGWLGVGINLFEIAGLVLVAIAMFQRRPLAQASAAI